MLAWTIYLSFAGALVLALLPSGTAGRHGDQALARWLALAVAVAGLALAVQGFVAGMGHGRVIITDVAWVPSMGVHYLLAADGISRVLVLLTGLAAVAGVLFSWNIELRTNQFFAFFLALIGGVYGVFLSFDLFLLFVFYEIAIVPKYFLIAIWGSTRVRGHEAGALLVPGFGDGADRPACGVRNGRQPLHGIDCPGPRRLAGQLPDVVFSAGLHGVCDSGRHVAVSHLGAHGPCGRAYGGFHAAGRRSDETGRVRLPARGHCAVSAWA
jgi:hypothetical protein